MELKGSKTEKNLQDAFAGESQARNKYTYFAEKAREEGYEQIANIFLETARNEQEHARVWFEELGGIGKTFDHSQYFQPQFSCFFPAHFLLKYRPGGNHFPPVTQS